MKCECGRDWRWHECHGEFVLITGRMSYPHRKQEGPVITTLAPMVTKKELTIMSCPCGRIVRAHAEKGGMVWARKGWTDEEVDWLSIEHTYDCK